MLKQKTKKSQKQPKQPAKKTNKKLAKKPRVSAKKNRHHQAVSLRSVNQTLSTQIQNNTVILPTTAEATVKNYSQPRVENTKATVKSNQPTLISHQHKYPSRYILDLKKIKEEKLEQSLHHEKQANHISQHIIDNLQSRKTFITKNLQQGLTSLQNRLPKLTQSPKLEKAPLQNNLQTSPKAVIKLQPQPKIKKASLIKYPRINWPSFNFSWPKLNWPKLQTPEIRLGYFVLPPAWTKTIAGFIIFSFILVSPFLTYDYYQSLQGKKSKILSQASQALWHLAISKKAASAQDFYYTSKELSNASAQFNQAQNEFKSLNIIVEKLITLTPNLSEQYQTADKILDAAEKLTRSTAEITATLEKIKSTAYAESNPKLTDKIVLLKDSLNLIFPDIKQASKDIAEVDVDQLPIEYQSQLIELKEALPVLENNLGAFIDYSDLILKILGHDIKKRYLVLFQNNNEIRPTGGFIGSYALVDIDRGNLQKIDIPGGGPYDLKAGLSVSIQSPKPLHLINQRWEFQDANWYPDFPTSAEKLSWFYEKSGGPTVDGIISVNATLLQKILSIIGPIELPEYNKTITADNFFQEIQREVELNYDKEDNRPKQIIADLTPKVIDKLLNADKQELVGILDLLYQSLNQKEIQIYFNNYTLEKLVLKYNWGGEIKNTSQDYLYVVSTNIAGEKTDAKIEQTADLKVNIQADGSVINTLKITKTHNGLEGEPFYGVPNLDYLRVYVPAGSELISATGFEEMPTELFENIDPEIYDLDPTQSVIDSTKTIDDKSKTEMFSEHDKTVFANWMKVNPGQTQTVTISYKLPFKVQLVSGPTETNYLQILKNELFNENIEDNLGVYSLLWQKQSGKENFSANTQILFPGKYTFEQIYPQAAYPKNSNIILNSALTSDQIIAVVFQQK